MSARWQTCAFRWRSALAVFATLLIAICLGAVATPARADAADPLADRMHRLTQDLRCLVCQNESLADSHAPLAMDLKREIRSMMVQGQSDEQIRDFLTQRYGDFVNYQPPLRAGTLLLWAGPLLLLSAGGWLVWRTLRSSQRQQAAGSRRQEGDAGAPGHGTSWHEDGQGEGAAAVDGGGGDGGGDGGGGGGD